MGEGGAPGQGRSRERGGEQRPAREGWGRAREEGVGWGSCLRGAGAAPCQPPTAQSCSPPAAAAAAAAVRLQDGERRCPQPRPVAPGPRPRPRGRTPPQAAHTHLGPGRDAEVRAAGRRGQARERAGEAGVIGVVTVRSGCPGFVRGRGASARARGRGLRSRGFDEGGVRAGQREGKAGAVGLLVTSAGRGAGREGALLSPPTGAPSSPPLWCGGCNVASGRLWGRPAGLGVGTQNFAGSGPRKDPVSRPERTGPRPLHSVRSLSSGPCV